HNGHVAFSRQHGDGSRSCMVFDVGSMLSVEIASNPGAIVFGTALGGNSVAFIDLAAGNGDIMVGSLAAPGAAPFNLSASADVDTSPAVAPGGDLVVWE